MLVLFPAVMKEIKLLNFPHAKIKFIIYTEPSVWTLQPHQYPLKRVIVGNSFAQIGFKVSDTYALSEIYPVLTAFSHLPNYRTSAFMGLQGGTQGITPPPTLTECWTLPPSPIPRSSFLLKYE